MVAFTDGTFRDYATSTDTTLTVVSGTGLCQIATGRWRTVLSTLPVPPSLPREVMLSILPVGSHLGAAVSTSCAPSRSPESYLIPFPHTPCRPQFPFPSPPCRPHRPPPPASPAPSHHAGALHRLRRRRLPPVADLHDVQHLGRGDGVRAQPVRAAGWGSGGAGGQHVAGGTRQGQPRVPRAAAQVRLEEL